jgi:site-specific recombinase XerD
MSSLRSALDRYLSMRKGFGYKYQHQTRRLTDEPTHSALIQRVLAIPSKRHDRRQVHFLTRPEIEAVLTAPDRTTWLGRRDHTLLFLATQTGLRLSELIGLDTDAIHLGAGAHVRCVGKGRKERCTPLTTHARVALQAWLKEPALRANDDGTNTCREFTLGGIGQPDYAVASA